MKRKNNIKILIFLSVILITSSFSIISADNSDEIQISYTFEHPITESTMITIHDADLTRNIGEPALPSVTANILIPYGKTVDEIIVKPKNLIELGNDFDINIVSKAIPISSITSDNEIEDVEYKLSKEEYPGVFFQKIGVYSFRGYSTLVLDLHPVQYNPLTGEAVFYKEMDVVVKLVDDDKSKQILYRGIDKNDVIKKVDNPSITDTYNLNRNKLSRNDEYDLLIITTNSLKDSFIPLQEAHENDGVRTQIKTLTDIGSNEPDDIRDFIDDEYWNGIKYVLIGGDDDVIPAKRLYVEANHGDTTDHLPSDLYYACLDGTFNYDGDGKWGESTDGDFGEDVDLIAEVYVGRACVGTTDEVDNFVEKTITYMNMDKNDPYLKKILLAGEQLDESTWGGTFLDRLVSDKTGIPPDSYNIEKLYDMDDEWTEFDIMDLMDENIHIIQHDGHSNTNYNLKMYSEEALQLKNDKPFFVYTTGCYPGAFDLGDCFAEYMTVKTDNGAFAGVWNSRYGWYDNMGGPGSSFQKAFVRGVFQKYQDTLGKANQYGKEAKIGSINGNCNRWTYYELNLFGDPAVTFLLDNDAPPPDKEPKIEIESINGGLFLSLTIENSGEAIAEDVKWGIEVEGGIFNIIDFTYPGNYGSIGIGEKVTVQMDRLVYGFGNIIVTATAECSTGSSDREKVDGKVFFIFTKLN